MKTSLVFCSVSLILLWILNANCVLCEQTSRSLAEMTMCCGEHPSKIIGDKLIEMKRYADAFRFYTRAIKIKSTEPSYFVLRGKCLLRMEQLFAAVCEFQKADTLARMLKKEVKFDLESTEYVRLGKEMFGRQKFLDAAWCYSKAINTNPADISYHILRANCYLENGSYVPALTDLEKVLSLAKDSGIEETSVLSDAEFAKLGELLFKKERYTQAEWCYTEAIKRNDSEASYHNKRGSCHSKMKQSSMAILDYEKALLKDPDNLIAKESLIQELFQAERVQEAIEKFCLMNATELLNLATKFEETEKFQEAIYCYSEVINRNPGNPSSLLYDKRAFSHWRLRNFEEAVKDSKISSELMPSNITKLFLCEVLIEMGKYKEAKVVLESLEAKGKKYFEKPHFCRREDMVRSKINQWDKKQRLELKARRNATEKRCATDGA